MSLKRRVTKSRWTQEQHKFSVAQAGVNRERSTFAMPSRTITAFDAGTLIPFYAEEILPGDTHKVSTQILGRLATPHRPFLDNIWLDTFFFFIPNRLVWENWKYFQGEKADPGDTTTYTIPQIDIAGGVTTGLNKLADYFGITTQATTYEVNALPFRGYNLVYNEFFRDQNLQDSVTLDTGDANSTEANHVILPRGRRKDYLTGCLPWPQRGDSVKLNLGTRADVKGIAKQTQTYITGPLSAAYETGETGSTIFQDGQVILSGTDERFVVEEDPDNSGFPNIYADLTNATAATVNQLRQSIAIQQVLELDARAGTRHPEQIKARFGVTSPDARLQRPEYLGGSSQNISVTAVPVTTANATQDPGDLGGYGMAYGSVGGYTHSFTEHGWVLGIASLRADYTYFQGIPRKWARLTRYDFYEPAFAALGEQPVYNSEIYVSNDANDALVFGYQERFGEYKYGVSMVTGIMSPNAVTNLAVWHVAEKFSALPTLGATFIEENPPIDRLIQVTSEPHFLCDFYIGNQCTRVMPVFNTPGLRRL